MTTLKHGDSRRGSVTTEYRTWRRIINCCTKPTNQGYQYYGGRGIGICDRWLHGEGGLSGYECFLKDMGRKSSPSMSIDRIDNNAGYEPKNCRWATATQQMRNRRGRRIVSFMGKRVSLAEAADAAGLPRRVVEDRLRLGWSENEALNTPLMPPFGGVGDARFARKRREPA